MFLHVKRLRISKKNVIPGENNYSLLHLLHFHRFTTVQRNLNVTMKQKQVFRSFLLLFDNAFLCFDRNCLAFARSQISQIILRVFNRPFR